MFKFTSSNYASFLFASFLLFTSFANAEKIRIDLPGGLMANFKVNDQGKSGTCYAQAAAQGWDAFRYKYNSPEENLHFERSSAEDLAIRIAVTRFNNHNDDFEGGFEGDALLFATQTGGCQQDYTNQNEKYDAQISTLIKDVALITQRYTYSQIQKMKIPIPNQSSHHLEIMQNHYDQLNLKLNFENYQTVKSETSLVNSVKSLLEILGIVSTFQSVERALLDNNNATETMVNLAKLDCPKEYRIKSSHNIQLSRFNVFPKDYSAMAKLNLAAVNEKLLSRLKGSRMLFYTSIVNHFRQSKENSLPVLIGYCGNLPKNGPLTDFASSIKEGDKSLCGPHASIITGIDIRSNNPSDMMVLVRNSYGETCKWAHPGYQCEKGSIWIPFNDLARNLMRWGTFKEI